MKKKLILKLIETNDTPKRDDLVLCGGTLRIVNRFDIDGHIWLWSKKDVYEFKVASFKQVKVVKAYGISDEEVVTGHGYRLDVERNTIGIIDDDTWYAKQPDKFKKVEILPEQFNYQDIVDLGLKDGDSFEVWTDMYQNIVLTNPSNLGVFEPTRMNTDIPDISKPSQVLYTEEEVYNLLQDVLSELSDGYNIKDLPNWFNQNKKK